MEKRASGMRQKQQAKTKKKETVLILAARNDGHSNTKQNHNSNTYKVQKNTNRILNVNRTEYEYIPFVDSRYYDQNIESIIRLLKWDRKTKHISSTKSDENLCTLCFLGFIV